MSPLDSWLAQIDRLRLELMSTAPIQQRRPVPLRAKHTARPKRGTHGTRRGPYLRQHVCGTLTGYTHGKCRCEACCAVFAAYQKAYHEKRQAERAKRAVDARRRYMARVDRLAPSSEATA